jgi:molecular chaperone DnaJ
MSAKDYLEKDYYQILGVSKEADDATLKKAYRKLARELHPDQNKSADAEDKFKAVSEAYDILSDPKKRSEYDQVRTYGAQGMPGGAGGFNGNFEDLFGGAGFNLGDLFGGQPSRGRRPRRGADLETEVTITFDECFQGKNISIPLRGQVACKVCNGTGAKPGTSPKRCTGCNGAGQVNRNAGGFAFAQTCTICHGTGQIIESKDPACQGTGVVTETRTVTARIPAGIKYNAVLRLKGKGEAGGKGGEAGDLFITIKVKEDQIFKREGDNVRIDLPVRFDEAVFGTQIAVPVPGGSTVTLKIPPATQNGRVFRVKNQGMPKANNLKGDLLVKVDIAIPQNMSSKAKESLQAFATEVQYDNPRDEIIAMNARKERI